MRLRGGGILLLAAILVAGACSGNGSSGSSVAQTITTAAATTTAAVTTATEPSTPPTTRASSPTWLRVSGDAAALGGADLQLMWGVAVGGPSLVAVGGDRSGGDFDAEVWTSGDGVIWARVPDDEAVFGGEGTQEMRGVAAVGPGVVAVGWDGSGGARDAAVWTSGDGVTWARVPDDEAVFGGPAAQGMFGVAAGGRGVVAVGYDESGGDRDAAVWTSGDGMTWARVPDDEAVFGGTAGQGMFSVVEGGPGFVAVGWDESGGDFDAAVWVSGDGVTWVRVPDDERVFGGSGTQEMRGVAVGGPGLVAVGYDESGGDRDAAVWTSMDGATWTRVSDDPAVFSGTGDQAMLSVAGIGPGLVAVGADGPSSSGDAAVWTSDDGVTWVRVVEDAAVFGGQGFQAMFSVAVGGLGVSAVGIDQLGLGDSDAAVWTTED